MTTVTGFGLDGRVVVRTARCRTRRGRSAVQEALDRVDPETGLPRSAILVVHRLQGELVGNPPRLARVELRSVAATAHRAGGSPPPPDCEAVLFTDEAELLVSLCRDVAAGRPLAWWWATLLSGAAVGGPLAHRPAVATAFERHVQALPAAAAQAPQAVAAAAATLPEPTVLRVVGAMAEAYGAWPLAEVARRVWSQVVAVASDGSSPPSGTAVGPSPEAMAFAEPGSGSSRPDPGRHDLHVAVSGVAASPVALLLDVARQLYSDPLAARTTDAAESFARRWTAATASGRHDPVLLDAAADDVVDPPMRTTTTTSPRADGRDEGGPDATPGDQTATQDADDDALVAGSPDEPDEPPDEDQPDVDVVVTALGGAFYLLNLLDDLDLPDSADGPGEPGALLTRWGVLALVLRSWPGIDLDDPLIPVIDALAWPDGSPVTEWTGLGERGELWAYRRPAAAGFGWGDGELRWWRDDAAGRLVLVDPSLAGDTTTAGVALLADVPAAADPDDDADVVRSELRRARSSSTSRGNSRQGGEAEALTDTLCPSLPPDESSVPYCLETVGETGPQRWGRRVAEMLQGLLAERGVAPDVVLVRARVACTGFSVRVHMALDDVDLDVRRAGLDRDPGWVPALGRVVELVFT